MLLLSIQRPTIQVVLWRLSDAWFRVFSLVMSEQRRFFGALYGVAFVPISRFRIERRHACYVGSMRGAAATLAHAYLCYRACSCHFNPSKRVPSDRSESSQSPHFFDPINRGPDFL